MKSCAILILMTLIAPLCGAAEADVVLKDEEIRMVVDGFSEGGWQRTLVSTFDPETAAWAQQEPGERWWMEKLSPTKMRSYADEGDPWEISLSPTAYVLTVLDKDGAASGETSYQITSASISGPRDWRLTLENRASEPSQVIEMVMFGNNYLFTLWTRDETGSRRDRWIALSHRAKSRN